VIRTKGLVPATVNGTLKEKIETTWINKNGDVEKNVGIETRMVSIPIWTNSSADPGDGSSITLNKLSSMAAEIWTSITELRRSNLKINAFKGHDYEWLAGGAILKSRVVKVMPYDGQTLHTKAGPIVVRSNGKWFFDWDLRMWQLDPQLARKVHNRVPLRKRQEDQVDKDDHEEDQEPKRTRLDQPYAEPQAQSMEQTPNCTCTCTCPSCHQKQTQSLGVDGATQTED